MSESLSTVLTAMEPTLLTTGWGRGCVANFAQDVMKGQLPGLWRDYAASA
jgi:hypothetical protein